MLDRLSGRLTPTPAVIAGSVGGLLVLLLITVGALVTAPAAASAPQPRGSSRAPNVCRLIPPSAIAKLAKEKVTGSKDAPVSVVVGFRPEREASGNQCRYTTPGNPAAPLLQVTVFVSNAAQNYALMYATDKPYSHPVKGIGKKAFFDVDSGLDVLAGSRQVIVNGTPAESDSPPSAAQDFAIAKVVLAKL